MSIYASPRHWYFVVQMVHATTRTSLQKVNKELKSGCFISIWKSSLHDPSGLLRLVRFSSILFSSGCGYEGHTSVLCSWPLISHVPRAQSALVSCIMEAVHLQDWNTLWNIPVNGLDFFGFSNQWFISHPPKRVTWIWISRCCTRIESLSVFNKYNTLNVFKLESFKYDFPALEKGLSS